MKKPLKLLILTSLIVLCSCTKKDNIKEDVIREMVTIVGVTPNYPKEAADNKIEGEVVLQFTVTKEGRVKEPEVLTSIPQGVFEKDAIIELL